MKLGSDLRDPYDISGFININFGRETNVPRVSDKKSIFSELIDFAFFNSDRNNIEMRHFLKQNYPKFYNNFYSDEKIVKTKPDFKPTGFILDDISYGFSYNDYTDISFPSFIERLKKNGENNVILSKKIETYLDEALDVEEKYNTVVKGSKVTLDYKDKGVGFIPEYDILILSKLNDDYENISFSGLFRDCKELRIIQFPKDLDTTNVINISYMFYECSNLTTINMSSFDTSKVTSMSHMFYGCSNLTTINMSSFDTSKVTSMSHMFYGCSNLTTVNMSSFNTSKVTSMSHMFFECSSLVSLDLSKFEISNVETINSMFSGCSSLDHLNLPKFDTSNKDIKELFSGCSNLVNIVYKGVEYEISEVKRLLDILPRHASFEVPRDESKQDESEQDKSELLKEIGNTFVIKDFSKYICLNYNNQSSTMIDEDEFIVLNDLNKHYEGVFLRNMFAESTSLTSITFPPLFDTSRVVDTSYMFAECSKISELNLSTFDTSRVQNMRFMFSGCSGLEKLNLSRFDTSIVEDMSSMFAGCSKISELNLSTFDTFSVQDMSGMFSGCSSLKKLDLSTFNTPNVNNMSRMFSGCIKLFRLDISSFDTHKCIKKNQNSGKDRMFAMFDGCNELKKVELSRRFKVGSFNDIKNGYVLEEARRPQKLDQNDEKHNASKNGQKQFNNNKQTPKNSEQEPRKDDTGQKEKSISKDDNTKPPDATNESRTEEGHQSNDNPDKKDRHDSGGRSNNTNAKVSSNQEEGQKEREDTRKETSKTGPTEHNQQSRNKANKVERNNPPSDQVERHYEPNMDGINE